MSILPEMPPEVDMKKPRTASIRTGLPCVRAYRGQAAGLRSSASNSGLLPRYHQNMMGVAMNIEE